MAPGADDGAAGRGVFPLAPDRVCKLLSPSTRRLDLHGKRPIHAREEVGHLWLVDPFDRTLEAFSLREGQWVLIATAKDDDPVCIRLSMLSPSASETSGLERTSRSRRCGAQCTLWGSPT